MTLIAFTLFLAALGSLTAFAADTHNLSQAMADSGLALPATLAMILLVWTTIDTWLCSAAVGISNIFEVRKVSSVLVVGAISIAVAAIRFHEFLPP